jgi:hypothetical protein
VDRELDPERLIIGRHLKNFNPARGGCLSEREPDWPAAPVARESSRDAVPASDQVIVLPRLKGAADSIAVVVEMACDRGDRNGRRGDIAGAALEASRRDPVWKGRAPGIREQPILDIALRG